MAKKEGEKFEKYAEKMENISQNTDYVKKSEGNKRD